MYFEEASGEQLHGYVAVVDSSLSNFIEGLVELYHDVKVTTPTRDSDDSYGAFCSGRQNGLPGLCVRAVGRIRWGVS